MNGKMKYFLISLISLVFTITIFSEKGISSSDKLVFVSVKNTDLSEYENRNCAVGLLSLKPASKNMESIYLATAYRRTFLLNVDLKGEIEFNEGIPEYRNYSSIKKALKKEYENMDQKKGIESIGQILNENGIKRAYYGNDEDYLIMTDNIGRYDKGDRVVPAFNEIEDFLDKEFEEMDIVFISIDSEEENEYIERLLESKYPVLLWSKYRKQNGIIRNRSLSTALYKDEMNSEGILTSDSTKRRGLINNLDLGTSILEYFNLENDNDSGKMIKIEKDLGKSYIEKIFNSYINLTISKYIFHGLTISFSFILIFLYFMKKDIYKKHRDKIYLPILFILFSIIYSFLSYNVFLYNGFIIISSLILFFIFKKKSWNIIYLVFILDFIMLIGIFFFKDILYNSFIGYNSILAGGRYYGLNNDIMGCFIATGILSSIIISKRIDKYLGFFYLLIHVLGLTGRYGSNFGGLLTIILSTAIFTYYFLFEDRNRKKIFIVLPFVLLIVLGVVFLGKGETNHIASFFKRVCIYGFIEFKDMIVKKIIHLIKMTILPPWSVIFIIESIYIIKRLKKRFKRNDLIKAMYLVSIGALFFNDTGVVAFTYINLFTIAIISYLEERGYEFE
ncbi:MAG: hypothetical protein Q4P31_04625 [Andreesenia angusta]|nr:hypothetical protein [Andreesenia angusta]